MTNARIHRDFTPSGKLQHLSQWGSFDTFAAFFTKVRFVCFAAKS